MKEIKIEKCPYCGGEELFECLYDSYFVVRVMYKAHKLPHRTLLYSLVCRDCGSVVRSYVKYPEELFPKKERRDD